MVMRIDPDQCIDCAACVEPCPNQAIFRGGEPWIFRGAQPPPRSDTFYIVAELCTECMSYYDTPQCVTACPVDCIARDPASGESKEDLERKAGELRKK
jgi:ferredoxin